MTVESEILKPRSDKRDYRRIVLPNSLEVLLISDPDTDKCAASMDVNVGSFSDPEGLEGLAHFLEHMLFFASEKYPLENSYLKYITEHGGATNAFTDSEHTNFYFDVNSDCFEEALDRFAQFFIRPLMSPDATLREIKAVDSENQKNLLSDAWRMDQLQKHLSAKSHPYHKFGTGNWDTLEVRPKEKGMDIRRELIKFYEENYSANLMHLVVYGKKSLDKIQNMVEDMFQEIRNTERSCSNFPGHPCTSEHLQILIKAVRIKQGHKLRVIWPITPSIHHYKEGPCMYLSHLIGHEGEGSLFFLLKRLGWATGLSAGEGDWTKTYSFFSVSIDLTDAGYEHVEDMLGLLFQYIFLLQKCGVEEWIFDELSAVCEIWFHFQDKIPPIDYVANLASNLRLYPPHDWLVASSLPSKFKPEIIQMVLTELTPNNVRILLESKKFEGSVDMVEPWYGTAFAVEKITDDMIQKWITFAPNDQLNIPAPNIFIPSDLALKKVPEKVEFPVLLRKSSFSRIWYKSDTMFFTPKAFVKIDFNCPESCHSPEASVLTDIFTRLLMDYLNEYAYDAQVAGLYYGIHHTDTGFQVILVGYNHKMRILLETIIEKVAQFEVKPDRFSVIKETLTRDYQNFKFQQPYQQAMYYCSLILEDHTWPWSEQLEALPHLEANDLTKFFPCMLSKAFLECYVAGNIEPNEAESLIQHMEDIFFKGPLPLCKPLFPSQHLTNRIIKLERCSSNFYPIEGLNPSDENSALHYYIQVDRDDFKLNVKLQLFVLVAKEAAFHQLRSVEQLGYITVLMPRSDSGIQGIQFIVQSTVKDSAQLDERVEAFLKMFESKLHAMTNDEYKEGKMKLRRSSLIKGGRTFATKDPRSFASNINALINMKLEKHKNLREESRFYWREIVDGTLKFDRRECEVAALRELTQQDLIDFFNEYIKVGAPQRKKLSLQIYGALHSSEFKAAMYGEISSQSVRIDDIFSFRRSQALYGSFRGGGGHVKL